MIHPARIANKPALGAAGTGMREPSGAACRESLAEARLPSFEIPLWRAYSDQIHQTWIQRRTGQFRPCRPAVALNGHSPKCCLDDDRPPIDSAAPER
jgi:hypothetical protein